MKKLNKVGADVGIQNTMPATKAETLQEIEGRRLRREDKRARQREQNIIRAEKMHAARLSGKYHAPLIKVINEPLAIQPKYHIGCSGWYYWDWKGIFYPVELPTARWFDHYMDHFDTVELNAPFYSWPTVATVRSWLRQAGERQFIYSVKVCELITHIKRFNGTRTLIKNFGVIADILGPSLGCFLFQLPPSFSYTPVRLRLILDQLDNKQRNVVEFRHASWWNETVYKAFRKNGAIFCSCSAPKLPDELIKTADDIYIRFHGTKKWYRHDYSDEEIEKWAARIHASEAQHVWVYFNNDYDGYAIKNARRLMLDLRNKDKAKA